VCTVKAAGANYFYIFSPPPCNSNVQIGKKRLGWGEGMVQSISTRYIKFFGNFQYMYNLESLKESGAKSWGKISSCVRRKIRVLTLFYMGDL
jgi:hypothetical protein